MSVHEQIALVEAVGMNPEHMTTEQVYEVSGKILRDDILTQAALKFIDGNILRKGARAKAIREMSPAAREALRKRIQ